MSDLSDNATRALLFQYALDRGIPETWAGDKHTRCIRMFCRISGLGEAEALAAFAELEDAQMIDRLPDEEEF
ncbi:MAG TPA: hypothetical protein VMQ17_08885 [Candidatus Sulfotelmatobacter sp.]|nr:hypothetical protein [Candidatus Sulfotelmatobacter sp.]